MAWIESIGAAMAGGFLGVSIGLKIGGRSGGGTGTKKVKKSDGTQTRVKKAEIERLKGKFQEDSRKFRETIETQKVRIQELQRRMRESDTGAAPIREQELTDRIRELELRITQRDNALAEQAGMIQEARQTGTFGAIDPATKAEGD